MNQSWTNRETRLFRVDGAASLFMFPCGVKALFPKQGRALLYGKLPQGQRLSQDIEGATLEIVWGRCGRPDDYKAGKPIIRLSNCSVRADWIPDPVLFFYESAQILALYVSIDCEIEILDKEGVWKFLA